MGYDEPETFSYAISSFCPIGADGAQAEQQSVLMLHRSRALLVRQRTMLVNAIRAHMAELGIVARVKFRSVRLPRFA